MGRHGTIWRGGRVARPKVRRACVVTGRLYPSVRIVTGGKDIAVHQVWRCGRRRGTGKVSAAQAGTGAKTAGGSGEERADTGATIHRAQVVQTMWVRMQLSAGGTDITRSEEAASG